ncbi:MAG TPA: ribbon-helix-helix protein, CopG family [Longimicrobiaceae bacterium]|nr:ribbon-helix-helix protein, CopG family [Longimicrobiaceae bacterium]
MSRIQISIDIDAALAARLDGLVRERGFINRGQAIEALLIVHFKRARDRRLSDACARLDPAEERALAEEGLEGELEEWPVY